MPIGNLTIDPIKHCVEVETCSWRCLGCSAIDGIRRMSLWAWNESSFAVLNVLYVASYKINSMENDSNWFCTRLLLIIWRIVRIFIAFVWLWTTHTTYFCIWTASALPTTISISIPEADYLKAPPFRKSGILQSLFSFFIISLRRKISLKVPSGVFASAESARALPTAFLTY